MLKIIKGLKPTVDNDDSEGIHIYTDDEGRKYVRVTMMDEDFCLAAHDYPAKGVVKWFTWDDAKKAAEADGFTMLTKEQAELCMDHRKEINSKLEEIGGDRFNIEYYWTSYEHYADAEHTLRVRPVIDLLNK